MNKNMFRRTSVSFDDLSEIKEESFTNDLGVSFTISKRHDSNYWLQLTVENPFQLNTGFENLNVSDYETAKLEASVIISSKFESISSYLDVLSEKLLQQFEY